MASPVITQTKRSSVKDKDEACRIKTKKMAILNGLTCTICMDNLDPGTTKTLGNCHHSFCYTCLCKRQISKSISWHRCPLCRQLIYAKDRLDILKYFTSKEVTPPFEKKTVDLKIMIYDSSYLTQDEHDMFSNPSFENISASVVNIDIDINALKSNRGSILHSIAGNPPENALRSLTLLVNKHKMDVDILDGGGSTPLDWALREYHICPDKKFDFIKGLLSYGADPNHNDRHLDNCTSLLTSSLKPNEPRLVELLMSYGAKPPEDETSVFSFLVQCKSAQVMDIIFDNHPKLLESVKIKDSLPDKYLFANVAYNGNIQMMQYWKNRGLNTLHGFHNNMDLLCLLFQFTKNAEDFLRHIPAIRFLCRTNNWNNGYNWQNAITRVLPSQDRIASPESGRIRLEFLVAIKLVFNVVAAVHPDSNCCSDFINEKNLLHKAIIANDYDAAQLFLSFGASLHSRDCDGKRCLDLLDDANDEIKILFMQERERETN